MIRRRQPLVAAEPQYAIQARSLFRPLTLPDSSRALGAMRDSLWLEFVRYRGEFDRKKATMARTLPYTRPNRTPEYWNMLVSHRRWTLAMEKFERLFGGLKSPSTP